MADQVEQSRVCRVVLERLNTHGQSVKVNAQLDDMCMRIVDLGLASLPFVLDNKNRGSRGGGEEEGEGRRRRTRGRSSSTRCAGTTARTPSSCSTTAACTRR